MHVDIDLLKHPYPYKCAFTLCNDCDHITREAFETIHQFINTTDDTGIGKGLGLRVADTMFMYCQRPEGFSFFKGDSAIPGEHSGFLKEAVREGWIDSLHGYGDFEKPDVFSREMAERALNELDKNNIKLKVWIDHGSVDNSQNFNLPSIVSKGDNPRHKAYHTDLLRDYGVIFMAGYNSDWIGQNGKRRYLSKPLPQPEVPYRLLKRMHGRFCGRRLLGEKRMQRYRTGTYKHLKAIDHIFPLARLPYHLFFSVIRSKVSPADKIKILFVILSNAPLRHIVSKGKQI